MYKLWMFDFDNTIARLEPEVDWAGGRPILALDMYEHSYHIEFGAKAAGYVDTFMEVIRWDNPTKLYDRYSKEV